MDNCLEIYEEEQEVQNLDLNNCLEIYEETMLTWQHAMKILYREVFE
jgi:hypothetical protein